MRYFFFLVLISTVSFYVSAQQAIRLVPSDPIVVDGKIGEAEWKDAARFELSGSGTVFLKFDGEHLLVGVRGVRAGWSHLYLSQGANTTVDVLHASAALGFTRYTQGKNKLWQPSGIFAWDLRDQAITPETNRKMSEYLAKNLWVANNNNMGNPTEIEFKAKLRDPRSKGLRLAVVYAADAKVPQYFPASLKDDSLKEELIFGNTPADLRFAPKEWAQVEVVKAASK
jgi:hypothetical protein